MFFFYPLSPGVKNHAILLMQWASGGNRKAPEADDINDMRNEVRTERAGPQLDPRTATSARHAVLCEEHF